MNTNIIEIDGKEYELCLNRKAVKIAEASGLTPEAFEKRPINTIDLLWRASFLAKHPEVDDNKAFELYEKCEEQDSKKLGKIIQSLMEQYTSFFKALSVGE